MVDAEPKKREATLADIVAANVEKQKQDKKVRARVRVSVLLLLCFHGSFSVLQTATGNIFNVIGIKKKPKKPASVVKTAPKATLLKPATSSLLGSVSYSSSDNDDDDAPADTKSDKNANADKPPTAALSLLGSYGSSSDENSE